MSAYYYVMCPVCGNEVEIPDDAVGPDREDPWNIAPCYECNCTFDYNDDEVGQGNYQPREGEQLLLFS